MVYKMTLDTKYNNVSADLKPVTDQSFIWIGPVIWRFVPENMKNIKYLDIFKQEIRKIKALVLGIYHFGMLML